MPPTLFSERCLACLAFIIALGWMSLASVSGAALKTKNVFLITADGLRWQEVFRGAEESLIDKDRGGVREPEKIRRDFWRATPEERRRVLMPFFWSEIATKGQLYGNQDKGSVVRVTNGRNFSFPGYNEILSGRADPRIDTNDKKPNPNITVLEWLHARSDFQGKVATFGCWDVFPYILNRDRAGFPVGAGWEIVDQPDSKRGALHQVLRATPRVWDNVIYDAFMFQAAWDYLQEKQPRVLYLAFGETDDWAHDGRYDLYLQGANRLDQLVQRLWTFAQTTPAYKDQTSIVITTDHGRGIGPVAWKSHGESIPESALIWIAVLGPDSPALGERSKTPPLVQGQIAATVAALLGEDYLKVFPRAAAPLPIFFPPAR
ncbi:MAG: hypothetical protein L0Z50_33485 [Verrucomicrobiales bacterium]|nr:hypothetical protein [Verrucomicrobiales bacterium]